MKFKAFLLILVASFIASCSKKEETVNTPKNTVADTTQKVAPKQVVDTTPKKVVIVEKEATYQYMEIEQSSEYWISLTDRKVFLTREEALNFYGAKGWRYVDTQPTEKGAKITLELKTLK